MRRRRPTSGSRRTGRRSRRCRLRGRRGRSSVSRHTASSRRRLDSGQSSNEGIVRGLGLEAGIEEERVVARAPGVLVTDSPRSDTDAVLDCETSVHDLQVVCGRGVDDVELGDGALGCDGADSLEGAGHGGRVREGALAQVRLGADAVDRDVLADPLGHVLDEALRLGVAGAVEVVVVDVQLCVRVGGAGGVEGDADVVFAQYLVPVGLAEGAVFVEDLVGHILTCR